MKLFFKFLFFAILFYVIQIIVEILVRLFLEYSGLMRSEDYSTNSLFISAFLYVGGVVVFTKIVLCWVYIILFISLCYFLKSKLRYSLINMISCMGSGLITFYYEDRLNIILSFYLPIVITSSIIVIGDFLINRKKEISTFKSL
jgi:hypothetical protein